MKNLYLIGNGFDKHHDGNEKLKPLLEKYCMLI